MRKWIALLLAVLLCLSVTGCGGSGNPDHDYVLSLMEKGDYDMAIQILEHLKEQAGGAPATEATQDTVPTETAAPTEASTEAPTEAPAEVFLPNVGSNVVQMTIDLVNRFMEEKGYAMVEAYENNSGSKAREVSVSHAMEYRLENWDTFNAHFLLVCLEADVAYDIYFNDKLYILQDLDSGMIYDSSMLHNNIPDPAATMEDVCLRAINAYLSHLMHNPDLMWSEREIREELTDADISKVNEAIK